MALSLQRVQVLQEKRRRISKRLKRDKYDLSRRENPEKSKLNARIASRGIELAEIDKRLRNSWVDEDPGTPIDEEHADDEPPRRPAA